MCAQKKSFVKSVVTTIVNLSVHMLMSLTWYIYAIDTFNYMHILYIAHVFSVLNVTVVYAGLAKLYRTH